MEQIKKNLEESIYNRLKNVAKTKGRPVQEVLKYYAMERFLYRLSSSSYSSLFFLKGGLMLMVWDPSGHRATIDIDLLSKTSNSSANLLSILKEILALDVVDDGIKFLPETLRFSETQNDAEYQGFSASFSGRLFTAKLPMRIDFGFSDTILPAPAKIKYPTLLDFPAPELKGYTPETLIAEKFEAILRLGSANTRMKDFYDIWVLIHQFNFDRTELLAIIRQVLKNRGTFVEGSPAAFTSSFYDNPAKNDKWNAFIKSISREPILLKNVVVELRDFFIGLLSEAPSGSV